MRILPGDTGGAATRLPLSVGAREALQPRVGRRLASDSRATLEGLALDVPGQPGAARSALEHAR